MPQVFLLLESFMRKVAVKVKKSWTMQQSYLFLPLKKESVLDCYTSMMYLSC